jgi:hypothetical protein
MAAVRERMTVPFVCRRLGFARLVAIEIVEHLLAIRRQHDVAALLITGCRSTNTAWSIRRSGSTSAKWEKLWKEMLLPVR